MVVVGVRFDQRGPVRWYLAGEVVPVPGDWVVISDAESIAQVVVGTGQCIGFPGDPSGLPTLLRRARDDEVPRHAGGDGQALLESLP